MAVLISLPEYFESGQINLLIIHINRVITEVILFAFRLRQIAFLNQGFQINIIRIACKGRKRLIRRIPIACRSQRQYLPVGLPCFF